MRGLAAAALGAALCVACTAKPNLPAIGTSNGGGPTANPPLEEADAAVSVGGHDPIPSDFRAAMTRIDGARFSSKGHAGGRWEADVYATANGAAALAQDQGAVPVGARFVEEHFERGDAGAGPRFMMEKRAPGFDPSHGDWRYVAVGAGGEVAGDGAIASCAGCHGDAPHDHLFRVVGREAP